jgi:hypothetical protein
MTGPLAIFIGDAVFTGSLLITCCKSVGLYFPSRFSWQKNRSLRCVEIERCYTELGGEFRTGMTTEFDFTYMWIFSDQRGR